MVKPITIRINNTSDGVNNADQPTVVGSRYIGKARPDPKNGWRQIASCLDFMLHALRPRPGSQMVANAFTTTMRGVGTYRRYDGTDTLLAVSGGILYAVNKSTGALTQLYDMGGDGEAWFADYVDKCFVCNGTNVVKVESASVAYPVSIAAPTGVSAAAAAGGSLADGVYSLYACYGRGTSLYSTGQSLGSVTLGTGNNTIAITNFANSSDSQVSNKVIFMTDAGGSTYYFYHQTGDNSTTSFDISSTSARDTTSTYGVDAQNNLACPAFDHIAVHNGRLYGSVSNVLYWSLRVGNVYDLERFNTAANGDTATYHYQIDGIFSLGEDLYLNTKGGLYRIPNGDPNNELDLKQGWFRYPRTVVHWNQGLLGLTDRGVQFFDGQRMHQVDLSRDVKNDIDKLVTGYSNDTRPCGAIYRRDSRTEYHLCYRDTSIGTSTNNRRLVLNLDTLRFGEGSLTHAAWEKWSNGAHYMVVDDGGNWYCGQSHESGSVIYKEYNTRNIDENIYIANTLQSGYVYGWEFETGTIIPSVRGITQWESMWVLANFRQDLTITITVEKYPQVTRTETAASVSTLPLFGVARFGVDRFAPENPIAAKQRLSVALKGRPVKIKFSQSAEDRSFELLDSELYGILQESVFT